MTTSIYVHLSGAPGVDKNERPPRVGVDINDAARPAYAAIRIGDVTLFLGLTEAKNLIDQLAALHGAAVLEAVERSLSRDLP